MIWVGYNPVLCSQNRPLTLFIYCFTVCVVSRYSTISIENKEKATKYIYVRWNDTIKELKQKVSYTENIDIDNVDLVLHGKRLNNDEKRFQIEIFDQKTHKDTTSEKRIKRWLPGVSGHEEIPEQIPVLQVVNR